MEQRLPDTMTLREMLGLLRRRAWYAALPLLLALGASTAGLFTITPAYRASTTLLITSPTGVSPDYEALLFHRNLAKTYVEVAGSRGVAAKAIGRLGLTDDPDDLRERISVSVVRDTEVIAITAEDKDPERAMAIANTVATIFREEFLLYTSLDTLRVIDPASLPRSPIRPRPVLYTAVAAVAGGSLGIGLAFLADHLGTDPRPVEQAAGAPLPPRSRRLRTRRWLRPRPQE